MDEALQHSENPRVKSNSQWDQGKVFKCMEFPVS